jgi:hypothetical protein
MQIALFWPKLLPAFFLKKPWYPCPFEILEEALHVPSEAWAWFHLQNAEYYMYYYYMFDGVQWKEHHNTFSFFFPTFLI